MRNPNIISIILFFVAILLSWVSIQHLSPSDRTFVNETSLAGTICSIFGLLIALIQIGALKNISYLIGETIKETTTKLADNQSLARISKTEDRIDVAQSIVRQENLTQKQNRELVIKELMEIQKLLNHLKSNLQHTKSSSPLINEIEKHKFDVQVVINNLIDYKKDGRIILIPSGIHDKLEEVKDFLAKYGTQLQLK